MIKAVIFDMDGLLIDSEPFWRAVQIGVFKEVGVHLTEKSCLETMGLRLDQAVQYRFNQFNWSGPSTIEIQKRILAGMRVAIGERSEFMPGAREAIEYVKASGLKVAVASSSPMVLIDAMIQRFKLHDVFEVLQSAEHEAKGKPDPAVYLSAAKALGVAPEVCLAVEDSVAGLTAAKAAKMLGWAVPEA